MNLVRTIGKVLVIAMVFGLMAAPAFAEEAKQTTPAPAVSSGPFSGPAMGAGLGAGLVIIGAAMGFGKIGSSALESMARQPETAGQVQTAMIIIGALLEGASLFALVVCFLLSTKA